jgi:hypothetical protein
LVTGRISGQACASTAWPRYVDFVVFVGVRFCGFGPRMRGLCDRAHPGARVRVDSMAKVGGGFVLWGVNVQLGRVHQSGGSGDRAHPGARVRVDSMAKVGVGFL